MTMEADHAGARMFAPGGLGAKHNTLFPGTRPGATAEEVAAGLNQALDRVEAGDFELVGDGD